MLTSTARYIEAMRTVSKEFLKNSFSFSRYRLLKSKNTAGQILGFHRFPKNIVGRFLSVMSLTIFTLGTNLTFMLKTRIFFLRSGLQESFVGSFLQNISRGVVCPEELQGISNMWICPILSPILIQGFTLS